LLAPRPGQVGRNIRPYSRAILAATALCFVVAHTLRNFAMNSTSQVVVTDERIVKEPQAEVLTSQELGFGLAYGIDEPVIKAEIDL
jgi:hypothetical protein